MTTFGKRQSEISRGSADHRALNGTNWDRLVRSLSLQNNFPAQFHCRLPSNQLLQFGPDAPPPDFVHTRAAQFAPDGASVIIDSGSTTQAVARALTDGHKLTVYTNDRRIALLLGSRNDNRVTLPGGELSDLEDATFGLDSVQQLSQYHTDFAFVGAGGISQRRR